MCDRAFLKNWDKDHLTREQRQIVMELLAMEDDLAEWEQEYVDSIADNSPPLTDRQHSLLSEIYDRRTEPWTP